MLKRWSSNPLKRPLSLPSFFLGQGCLAFDLQALIQCLLLSVVQQLL